MCEERPHAKMASIYWAWTWPTGDRRAYKQFFDATCFAAVSNTLHLGSEIAQCPVCGNTNLGDTAVEVWATVYVPGDVRRDDCVVFDRPCFEGFHDYFVKNAKRLAERQGLQAGGPPPATREAWPSWGAMGITPA